MFPAACIQRFLEEPQDQVNVVFVTVDAHQTDPPHLQRTGMVS